MVGFDQVMHPFGGIIFLHFSSGHFKFQGSILIHGHGQRMQVTFLWIFKRKAALLIDGESKEELAFHFPIWLHSGSPYQQFHCVLSSWFQV